MKYLFVCLSLLFSGIAAAEQAHELTDSDFTTPPKRIISIEWATTETLLSLGVTPVGMADMDGYKQWVIKPALPAGIADVGARNEPNLELISELKPDLILISKRLAPAYDKLSQIAPTIMFNVYNDEKTPLKNVQTLTLKLGKVLGKSQTAANLIARTQTLLRKNGDKIRAAHPAIDPLLFVRIVDNSTLHFQGKGSLIHDTIHAMGLKNEWHGKTNFWGFSSVEIAKVAEHQQANIFLLQSVKKAEKQKLLNSPLWQAMAFSQQHKVYELPPIWSYGGLLAAQRFSNQLVNLLTKQP
ncbi:ABC transporter substrate-binding protein [Marinomonas pollencensis]|uniref:Iron complex transport system substrate-binding protein n=1 Tax=Marinomonas pollencensis TaxID=491954 RepID=A0A3E0DLL1_9GAMM|nr:ABC transporter substrate-binding protein [Marinomonas pollencensis]REG83664.1 iron complex transport system substrate-binding protein [Marinomonas pollencensis]